MILDPFGREIKAGKRPETRELAITTVRDRWSTYPSAGLTPERLAAILKEADAGDAYRQAELFEEMEEKDAHIAAEFGTRKNAVLGLDYDVAPFSKSAEDQKIRDLCADALFSLPALEENLLDLLDAVAKGYSLAEIVWNTDGRHAVISGMNWIHAKRAVFYDRSAGDLQAKSFEAPKILTVSEPFEGEAMPPWKMVYHRYKARSGYDTRAGIMRVCAWMYLFKNYALKDWAAFAEIFGMPVRIGKYEPGAKAEEKIALMDAVRNLGRDAAAVISKNTEIEFAEAMKSASGENVYRTLAEFCNKEISKAVLGQTATAEGTPGRLGSEDAQDRVRRDLVRADAEGLARTVRAQIIRPLVGFNFGWEKPLPWFQFKHESPEDLRPLSEVYKNVWSMGQPISREHVAERFKIPLPAEGETLLAAPKEYSPQSPQSTQREKN